MSNTARTDPLIICTSTQYWDEAWFRKQHFMAHLAKTRRVLYVEPSFSILRRPSAHCPAGSENKVSRARMRRRLPNLWTLTPPRGLPLWTHPLVSRWQYRLWGRLLRLAARRLGHERTWLWLYNPLYVQSRAALQPERLIFDLVDDLGAYQAGAYSRPTMQRCVEDALRHADLAFTTSSLLAERYAQLTPSGKLHVVPNGVRGEWIDRGNREARTDPGGEDAPGESRVPGQGGAPGESGAPSQGGAPGESCVPGQGGAPDESGAPGQGGAPGESRAPGRGGAPVRELPADLRFLPRPWIGFMGAIFVYLDFDLLLATARAFPDASLVMVGPVQDPQGARRLSRAPNVHFLGRKPQNQVPDYVGAFDVCLCPFKAGAVRRAVNPLKIYEYLALGRPVVSTPLESLATEPVAQWIRFAEEPSAFVAAVRETLEGDGPERRAARRQAVRPYAWEVLSARVAEILAAAESDWK
ncbi:MAG: glycosyltransferase [Candidatus Eisenbacteria sp.]|nr:glycosyltransferase [Candidatus Eisenbacteria bacterium]